MKGEKMIVKQIDQHAGVLPDGWREAGSAAAENRMRISEGINEVMLADGRLELRWECIQHAFAQQIWQQTSDPGVGSRSSEVEMR